MTKKTFLTITVHDKGPAMAGDMRPVRSLRPMRSMSTRKSLRPNHPSVIRAQAPAVEPK